MSKLKSSQQISAAAVPSFEEQVTLTFRLAACWLASQATKETRAFIEANDEAKDGSNASILPSLTVAQHLLAHHPGFVPNQLDQQLLRLSEDSSSLDGVFETDCETTASVYFPCCKQCGGSLQAHCNGTSVRVLAAPRMSRSQRRRLTRKHQTKASKSRKNDPQYARIWDYGQSADCEARLKEQCLQVTCGSCGSSSYVPTRLDTEERTTINGDRQGSKAMTSSSSKKPKLGMAKPSIRPVAKKESGNKDDQDFLRLPSAKRAAAPPVPLQRLDQTRKKKKSKKGDNPLMDFLSSLNN